MVPESERILGWIEYESHCGVSYTFVLLSSVQEQCKPNDTTANQTYWEESGSGPSLLGSPPTHGHQGPSCQQGAPVGQPTA